MAELEIQTFHRKSFPVEAVRVTAANMQDVARWCGGEVELEDNPTTGPQSVAFIKVDVKNPLNERQTKAYVGDWVLFANQGHKVYKNSAFEKSFVKPENNNVFDKLVVNDSSLAAAERSSFPNAGGKPNPGGTHVVGQQ